MFSAMGPQYQKYLWWKKYLTTLQMVRQIIYYIANGLTWILFSFEFIPQVQFILIMVHAFQLLFIDCDYPKAFVWWIGMHAVMFFFLFNEFYKAAYKNRAMVSENREHPIPSDDVEQEMSWECFSRHIIMIIISCECRFPVQFASHVAFEIIWTHEMTFIKCVYHKDSAWQRLCHWADESGSVAAMVYGYCYSNSYGHWSLLRFLKTNRSYCALNSLTKFHQVVRV